MPRPRITLPEIETVTAEAVDLVVRRTTVLTAEPDSLTVNVPLACGDIDAGSVTAESLTVQSDLPVNLKVAGDSAGLIIRDDNGTTDQKVAQFLVNAGQLFLRALNDAETAQTVAMLTASLATGDVTVENDLMVTGDLIVDYPSAIRHTGTGTDYVARIQDGTGRYNVYLNSSGGLSPTFIYPNEDALRLLLTTAGTFAVSWADGTGKAAGDPITWVELLKVNSTDVTYKGTSLLTPPETPEPLCILTGPTPASLTTGAWASMSWTTQTRNVGGMHSLAVNPSRVTAQVDGIYEMTYNLARATTNALGARITKNGAAVGLTETNVGSTAGLSSHAVAGVLATVTQPLLAGDYVEAQFNSGSASVVRLANFSVRRVGDY